MAPPTWAFPDNFLWGTATASYQVEGDNANSDWWHWEAQPGRIRGGDRSGKACDWWGGRWAEDLDRAADAGQRAHRLSIEWSRIEPEPGRWDEAALVYYREMLLGARSRGLTPLVTLHHFTNPQWLTERGGWLNADVAALFERYVDKVVTALGDLADLWITVNEPNVLAYSGYAAGDFPPGQRNLGHAFQVMVNLTLAHAAAYHAIRALRPAARIGLAHHVRGMRPARRSCPLDHLVAWARSAAFNEVFARAAQDGIVRLPGRRVSVPEAVGTQDFFGLNYYTTEVAHFDPGAWNELMARSQFPPGAELSPNGFLASVPAGLSHALRWARRFKLPIIITESGTEDPGDDFRLGYLLEHLHCLWNEIDDGAPVIGYLHWTLVDNFEWAEGWSLRFGLWGLDLRTQQRTRRRSVDLYEEICRLNSLTADMLERYAPQVLERVLGRAERHATLRGQA